MYSLLEVSNFEIKNPFSLWILIFELYIRPFWFEIENQIYFFEILDFDFDWIMIIEKKIYYMQMKLIDWRSKISYRIDWKWLCVK